MPRSSHVRSAAKAVTWRVVGAVDTFILGFIVTGSFGVAGSIMGFEVLTKSVLYYFHERIYETSFIQRIFG